MSGTYVLPRQRVTLGSMARAWLVIAMAAGLVHAGFSVYWGIGGSWLVDTVGQQMTGTFADMRWLVVFVGLAKAACAVAPYVLLRAGRLSHGPSRWISWAGAEALVSWGGAGTIVGNLVLAGVITPDGGYDVAGQIGQAFLWDPLFLVWGLALMGGLMAHRREARR